MIWFKIHFCPTTVKKERKNSNKFKSKPHPPFKVSLDWQKKDFCVYVHAFPFFATMWYDAHNIQN